MKKITLISLVLGLFLAACAPALPVAGDESQVSVFALEE